MSPVAGAAVQGTVDKDDLLPAALNVANFSNGYGLGINSVGEAGIAVDGAFSGRATGQNGR